MPLYARPPSLSRPDAWPELPLEGWRDTKETLHLWTQVVGKIRAAYSPRVNHWWNSALYVNGRGLTTSLIPYDDRGLEIEFDFADHRLHIFATDGTDVSFELKPRAVADFYELVLSGLADMDFPVDISPTAVELPEAIRLDRDREHDSYDRKAAERFWQTLVQIHRVFSKFRGGFVGKSSPSHFFWGSFDMAVTRFSGRQAPEHPGGIPHLSDQVVRESYSHELSSAGWWPGGGGVDDAAFYSYAYPEPDGFAEWPDIPEEASYHEELHEFVLPYRTVRQADDPDGLLLDFLHTTYEAAAELGDWPRKQLERQRQ